MAALRSALATLSRGSCGSSAAAYMGGGSRRGLELNQVVRHAAPPALPVAPLPCSAATRNFKGYRYVSSGVKDTKYKSNADMSMWDRATYFKNKIANGMRLIITDLEGSFCMCNVCGYYTTRLVVQGSFLGRLRYRLCVQGFLGR